ncbi:MAG: 50S ribosomal protein L13 [Proteobacteria bacterium]|jgi:large subunit ribosomal protein L13|nr:MAG: 50S ribosomal protein L13 [Pseudomonadota bacterium]
MPVARPPRPTKSLRSGDRQQWWIVDAADQTLGRLSARIASLLRGKENVLYTPHADAGDFVVVVNAERVKLTGRKRAEKTYYRYTGWRGHLKSATADQILNGAHPERVIETAVRGMLPKNSLGRKLYRKLKVYPGPNHPHAAQQPQELSLG